MDRRWRRAALLGFALVLVANPLLVPRPTQPSHTYQAEPLVVSGDEIETRSGDRRDPVILPGVECYADTREIRYGSVLCALDARALERGSVDLSVDAAVATNLDGTPHEGDAPERSGTRFGELWLTDYRYTRVGGGFYERLYTPSNGTYRLRSVSPEAVLENVSVPYQSMFPDERGLVDPRPYRKRVVDRGTLTLPARYIDRSVVSRTTSDGVTYYYISHVRSSEPLLPEWVPQRAVTVVRWLLFLAGVAIGTRMLRAGADEGVDGS